MPYKITPKPAMRQINPAKTAAGMLFIQDKIGYE